MKTFLTSLLVFSIYKILQWTWRLEIDSTDEFKEQIRHGRPCVLAHWHGDEIALLQFFSIYKVSTIVSTSKDGEMMNNLVRWMGGETSRGSSTRGGVGALKGLFKLVQNGWNCSFAVDGPKGPIYKAKPGVFEISKRLKIPIYVAGVHCDRPLVFPKSWNQTYLPKPFAKITVKWLGPWGPVSENQDAKDLDLAKGLEDFLFEARKQAQALALNRQI